MRCPSGRLAIRVSLTSGNPKTASFLRICLWLKKGNIREPVENCLSCIFRNRLDLVGGSICQKGAKISNLTWSKQCHCGSFEGFIMQSLHSHTKSRDHMGNVT